MRESDQKDARRLFQTITTAWVSLFVLAASDFGQSWLPTPTPVTNWQSLAASADGTVLVGAAAHIDISGPLSGGVFVSTNAGNAWFPAHVPGNNPYSGAACSADGSKLAAAFTSFSNSGVYCSTNFGATWALIPASGALAHSLVSSADGNNLAIICSSVICISTNGGTTWTSNSIPPPATGRITTSADGNKLASVPIFGSQVFLSSNGGVTWSTNTIPQAYWQDVASSADGTDLVAAGRATPQRPGPIYTSSDSGLNWASNHASPAAWVSLASSADGTTLAGTAYGVPALSLSTNGGATWTSVTSPVTGGPPAEQSIAHVASSADGGRLVVAIGVGAVPGGIYVLQRSVPPQLKLAPVTGGLALSWLVPSTRFILQQNPDLTTTNWTAVTNTPTLDFSSLQYQVPLSPSNQCGFYRLVTP